MTHPDQPGPPAPPAATAGAVPGLAGTLAAEVAAVRAEHGRADGKAALLAAPAGVAVSVLAAGRPLAAAAAAAWCVCGVLALAVALPRLRRRGARSGFPAYAVSTPDTVLGWLARLDGDRPAAAYLVALSRLAVAKYRLVQAATAAAALALALTAGALL